MIFFSPALSKISRCASWIIASSTVFQFIPQPNCTSFVTWIFLSVSIVPSTAILAVCHPVSTTAHPNQTQQPQPGMERKLTFWYFALSSKASVLPVTTPSTFH